MKPPNFFLLFKITEFTTDEKNGKNRSRTGPCELVAILSVCKPPLILKQWTR